MYDDRLMFMAFSIATTTNVSRLHPTDLVLRFLAQVLSLPYPGVMSCETTGSEVNTLTRRGKMQEIKKVYISCKKMCSKAMH